LIKNYWNLLILYKIFYIFCILAAFKRDSVLFGLNPVDGAVVPVVVVVVVVLDGGVGDVVVVVVRVVVAEIVLELSA
jgi:hypothetical protein